MHYYIPKTFFFLCVASSALSILISLYAIASQFLNYRKPQEQRLVVRIQLMVPLFSITCLLACIVPRWSEVWVDPIREIYEAFVIYTFFSLLTLILGGERKILVELSLGKPPVRHPIFLIGRLLPSVDISDPRDFLSVKRGILQYVWFKPVYCLGMSLCRTYGWSTTFWVLLYNVSATLSLYDLALFWKCLYGDLKQYNPWSKFLCVKLIIFASYWQGIVIGTMGHYGLLGGGDGDDKTTNLGYVYQNAVLCVEMIGFALGHLVAFSAENYSLRALPQGARMRFWHAVRDCLGCGDLRHDFRTTFFGTDYNYRNFDSAEAVMAHADSRSRMARLNQGLRFANNGRERYWIDEDTLYSALPEYGSIQREEQWSEFLDGIDGYVPEDTNYPVVWDVEGYRYTRDIEQLRASVRRSYA